MEDDSKTPDSRREADNKNGEAPPAKGDEPGKGLFTGLTNRLFRTKRRTEQPEDEAPRPKKWFGGLVKDIAVSAGIVASLLLILYLYSGVWPPMVVIESQSMMHGEDSRIGVIDTGDLTLVKKVDDRSDIITYIEATCRTSPNYGFMTYGDYGNVIIYRKNGMFETPVIHRVIAWIEYNASASDPARGVYKGDLPDIGIYNISEYNVPGIRCYYLGYRSGTPFVIHLSAIFTNMARYSAPHGGFVTHGDHNIPWVDQEVLQDNNGRKVEPVRLDWVVGRAEGELPWFGLFKLWITGHPTQTFPKSSVQDLIITIIVLVVVPIGIDYLLSKRGQKRKSRKETREKSANLR
jgi:signal peptidase